MLLKGLKVVEYATYIAAPGAAGILADWGAEVIKVERPGGDFMRHAFAEVKGEVAGNPMFDLDNRGKRGVVLDAGKPEGRDALARLAATADVFLTNVRPAALARSGLDEATLRAANPKLVYAMVTGYGVEGPDAHKPGFDVTAFWARAGVASMTVPKDADPLLLRSGFGDHITSLATASAILAALYERSQTGTGRVVQTSLMAAGIYTMGSDLAVQMKFGKLASGRPRTRPINPMSTFFKSSDGRWFVHHPRGGEVDWAAFATAAGRPDMIDDPRFANGRERRENSAEAVAAFDAAFAAMTYEEIGARLDAADLVWGPVQTPADVAADPQALASGAIIQVEDGHGGTYPSPGAPARFPGANVDVKAAGPGLGQHTREVLAEIGYSPAEIEAIFAAGGAV